MVVGRFEPELGAAEELADALIRAEFARVDAVLTPGASLWSSDSRRVVPCVGRAEITATLRRLVAWRAPTRIRVLRNGSGSAVLAAFGDEEAVWSLEIAIDPPSVDAVMVWVPAPLALESAP